MFAIALYNFAAISQRSCQANLPFGAVSMSFVNDFLVDFQHGFPPAISTISAAYMKNINIFLTIARSHNVALLMMLQD
ncbi:MAG: hypothetical protein KAQ71_03090 [Desulfobulbaceae bacterium]|nr:hypothetical protein [Desulfobulbaceae bacterium]